MNGEKTVASGSTSAQEWLRIAHIRRVTGLLARV